MGGAWTRRAFLFSPPGAILAATAARGRIFPGARYKYTDPSTESPVDRLTSPEYASYLPGPGAPCVSRRRGLLFWSDRTGSPQAFQLDLKSGQARQVTEARDLDGLSVALLPNDEGFVHFDGLSLRYTDFKKLKEREVYRVADRFSRPKGIGLLPDGAGAALVETSGRASYVRLVSLVDGRVETVVERAGEIERPMPQPGGRLMLYRADGALWIGGYAGAESRRLNAGAHAPGPAYWAPDGKSVLFLNTPRERGERVSIWEADPDGGEPRPVVATSQFAQFAMNADATVFVGASASKASPYLVLMVRRTTSELSLCEHRAGNPALVSPVFSPDSQRVFFGSDRDGKPAIYAVSLEKLVEPT